MSELEAPNTHLQRSKRCSRGFGRRDSGPLELPAAPGLMTVVDLALYRSLEGELTPTICSARALLTVWLYVKEQAQTVLAFLFHCVPSLVEDDSSAPFDG